MSTEQEGREGMGKRRGGGRKGTCSLGSEKRRRNEEKKKKKKITVRKRISENSRTDAEGMAKETGSSDKKRFDKRGETRFKENSGREVEKWAGENHNKFFRARTTGSNEHLRLSWQELVRE